MTIQQRVERNSGGLTPTAERKLATKDMLSAAYAAEQQIALTHGSALYPRPTYEKASNTIAMSDVADPATDVDAATQLIHPLRQAYAVNTVVPQDQRYTDFVRGFNPNLVCTRRAWRTFSFPSGIGKYNTVENLGQDSVIDPGNIWSVRSGQLICDFTLSGDVFFLAMDRGAIGKFAIQVDGAIITPTITGAAILPSLPAWVVVVDDSQTGGAFIKCKFPSWGTRRIRLLLSGLTPAELYTRATSTITFNKASLRWLSFGDSFASGTTSDASTPFFVSGLHEIMNSCFGLELDHISSGVGGSGFFSGLKPGDALTDGAPASIRRVLLTSTRGLDADLITVLAGNNDAGQSANPVFASEVSQFIDNARELHPNALIVFFGANSSPGNITAGTDILIENKMAEICALKGIVHIPMQTRNPKFLRGSGKQGATNGTGNTDSMTGPDGTHPTAVGHQLTGEFMARELYLALSRV